MHTLCPPTALLHRCRRGTVLVLLAGLLAVTGCDSADDNPEAAADLPLSAQAQRNNTVVIEAPGSVKGDFLLYPVDVPPGGEFIIDLVTGPAPHDVLASVLHRGLKDGRTEVEVDMSGMGGLFNVEMRLDESVRHTSASLSAAQPQTVGSLRERPTSFHFEIVQEGDEQVIVVAVDYDRAAVGGDGVAWVTPEGGEIPVPATFLDIVPQNRLDASTEIAGVRMRGIGTGEIVVAEQHVQ
ncbi:MAG: hypothetical protein AAGI91_16115 [Bacteroidota bacterium]